VNCLTIRDGSLLVGMTGSDKSDRVMKNFVPETTGYDYFKKQNDRVLKKNSFTDNNKTLRYFKVLILLNILVPQLPIPNKPFNIINRIFVTNRTFQTLQNAKRK